MPLPADAGPGDPWQPCRMRRRLLDRLHLRAEVDSVRMLTPRMRLIALTGPELRELAWSPGQHVQVQVGARSGPADHLIGLRRAYSVWDYDGRTLQLCVLDHGGAPGADWARGVAAGDAVLLTRPQGRFTLRPDATAHLFVGEETAAVAFGPMLRAVPSGSGVHAVLEVAEPADRLPLPDGVSWRYRHGADAAGSATLLQAVRELDLPASGAVAYLAGELRAIQALRTHLLKDRGWGRRAILTKPFWTPGRTGLE